ncbi:MAG TPA: M1 family metallopeptidase [Thermoplasmata archaeon]|nr:M1 family metallopeptidase [Thermoplasmata archaeon]
MAGSGLAADPPRVDRYRLILRVDPESGVFGGTAELDLRQVPTDPRIDCQDLTVHGCWSDGSPVPYELDRPTGTMTLTLRATAAITLRFEFEGKATDHGLVGLYRCPQGEGTMLTTQCQPGGARRIFPCVDRPDRKAVFELEVRTPPGWEVVANTALLSEEPVDGWVAHRFIPTPPMATYLFYLGVGKFDWVRDDSAPPRIAVAAPRGRGSEAAFSLGWARRILRGLEEYFGIPYPLAKLDLVSISEHAWSAMENWGAITFRDMRLLADDRSSVRLRRDIVATLAHEIAHQWFGNLVTITEWTDIWLNESFASLMELTLVDRLDPDSGTIGDFLLTFSGPARFGDSLSSTHPVVTPVARPEEIGEAFDEISYGKGATVLRMVEAYLGPATFRRGVSAFLERHRFGNASSADLWRALEEESLQPVGRLLGAWVERPGLPLVRVQRADDELELRQERFSLDGRHRAGTWPIPLPSRGRAPYRLWETPRTRVSIDPEMDLTAEARGFYRIHLDDELFATQLGRVSEMSPPQRWAMFDDLVALTLSGDSPSQRLPEFIARVQGATDYLTVQSVAADASLLAAYAGNRGPFAEAARTFLSAQWERLGPRPRTGEAESDAALRERVAHARLLLDMEFAHSLASGVDDLDRIAPDLRGPVLAAAGRVGGTRNRDRLLRLLAAHPREADAFQVESALVSSRDPSEVAASLELLGTPQVHRAHAGQIVRRAAVSPEARAPTWAWIERHLESFDRDHPGLDFGGYVLQHALPLVGIGRAESAREFVRGLSLPLAARGAAKGLALLEVTDRFAARWAKGAPPV